MLRLFLVSAQAPPPLFLTAHAHVCIIIASRIVLCGPQGVIAASLSATYPTFVAERGTFRLSCLCHVPSRRHCRTGSYVSWWTVTTEVGSKRTRTKPSSKPSGVRHERNTPKSVWRYPPEYFCYEYGSTKCSYPSVCLPPTPRHNTSRIVL